MKNDVVLNMIVKDEAPVIERCLESVKPFVNSWVIIDTGSTDSTQDLIRQCMKGIPGELVERPWVNFAHNRNEALDLARTSNYSFSDDYAFFIDADETLLPVGSVKITSDVDGYYATARYGDVRYQRLALARLDRPWRWEGAVHEVLMLSHAQTVSLPELQIEVNHDGARSRDPETYLKDAALLAQELAENPGHPRTTFYLAQSYRDAGRKPEALDHYRQRAAMREGWDQEAWYSRFQMGVLYAEPGPKRRALLAAYDMRPTRAEPLVALAENYRSTDEFLPAFMYAHQATILPVPPASDLFIDSSVYTWRCWDELAISAYYIGEYEIGRMAAERALAVRPWDERLVANLASYQTGLDRGGVAASS